MKTPTPTAAPALTLISAGTIAATAAEALSLLDAESGNANTIDAHARDLRDFFAYFSGQEVTPYSVGELIGLDRPALVRHLNHYKMDCRERNLAPATINRRLATVRKLLRVAHNLGAPCPSPDGIVKDEKVAVQRDTAGPPLGDAVQVLTAINRDTLKGCRDYAILLLFLTNALRRDEVLSADIGDLNTKRSKLRIKRKGANGQKTTITLDTDTTAAIVAYLEMRCGPNAREWEPTEPLFCSCNRAYIKQGEAHRLTGRGLAKETNHYGLMVLDEPLHPHGWRHTAATAGLEATGGDVTLVQQLTGHKKIDVLLRYRDQMRDEQGEVTRLLADRIRALRSEP